MAIGIAPTLYDHWSADLASVADYYPGGNLEHDWSRMGYNGQIKDDEVYGSGAFLSFSDYGIYMRLMGRWDLIDQQNSTLLVRNSYLRENLYK